MPRFQKQATDASGLGGSGWRRSTESCARDRAGAFRAAHTRPCHGARGPQNTAPPSATHRVQQHRVSLEASRERGGAHARFSTLAPQPLSEPMAAAHRACEACLLRSVRHLNDAATATPLSLGAHFRRLHLSPSLTLRRLLRCAKPSARRPIAIAARKKAGLGARCSRGDPRPFFGRARVSFLACLLVNKPLSTNNFANNLELSHARVPGRTRPSRRSAPGGALCE